MAKVNRRLLPGLLLFLIVVSILILPLMVSRNVGTFSVSGGGKKIGVVPINGVIVSSRNYVRELRDFAKDDSIAAIIVRVNSPGGAVAPSQEMYREILRARKKKKVIVSMGSVAASGGYYISSAADYIFANPGTLTGSIGVIMEYMNIGGLLKWMKVSPVVIKSGKFKDAGSPYRAPTPEEKKYLKKVIMDVYNQFVDDVLKVREKHGLTRNVLLKIADGRVFSGREALKYHLVDAIGDFYDAVDYLKKELSIEGEPKLVYPRREKDIFSRLMDSITRVTGGSVVGEEGLKEFLTPGYNIMYLWR